MQQEQINQRAVQKLLDLIWLSIPDTMDISGDNLTEYIDIISTPQGNTIRVKGSNGASDLIISVSVAE